MARHLPPRRQLRHSDRLRTAIRVAFRGLFLERLEDRTMLDAGSNGLPSAIVVGRTLSNYFVGQIQNHQETITYTVYNEQADTETGVLLTTTLEPGVTIDSASVNSGTTTPLPDQQGQNLAWSLGSIQGYDRASVTLVVDLANTSILQLDSGAKAYATLDAGAVTATTPAATLRAGTLADPTQLASTPDANTTDPFIQEEAAKLDYNAQNIFNYLHTQVGYNSYTGSVRGARGTLWSAAGNALDVASLGVALMRASGIPAQYVSGTLSQAQAQGLILSMFPATDQTVGYIPSGTTTSDPANDPQLLTETENHYWFQFNTGTGMTNADPLMSGATIGQSFTTATGTFGEVADNLREKTEIKLNVEMYNQALALFGLGGGLSTTTVLDQTFNDVDLVGHPLTLGQFVTGSSINALVASATTFTYSPYLEVGDAAVLDSQQDPVINGTPFQEVSTSLPFGNQILTGLFADVTLSGPQGPSESYEHTILDRIGYAAREGLANVNLPSTANPTPALSNFDLTTLNVLPGLMSPRPYLQSIPSVSAQYQAIQSLGSSVYNDSTSAEVKAAYVGLSRLEIESMYPASDLLTTNAASLTGVIAYFDRPRITVVSINPNLDINIDQLDDQIHSIARPGEPTYVTQLFNTTRGFEENGVETYAPLLSGGGTPVSAASIFSLASQQGIGLSFITPSTMGNLDQVVATPDMKARITSELLEGDDVLVPSSAPLLNGNAVYAWYDLNPSTGDVTGMLPDGSHGFGDSIAEFQAFVSGFIEGFLEPVAVEAEPVIAEETAQLAAAQQKIAALEKQIAELEAEKNAEIALTPLKALKVAIAEVVHYTTDKFLEESENHGTATFITFVFFTTADVSLVLSGLDPEVLPLTSTLLPTGPTTGSEVASTTISVPTDSTSGPVAGSIDTTSTSITSAQLQASWSSNSTNAFQVRTLSSGSATIVDSSGKIVGTGPVSLASGQAIAASVSGHNDFLLSGSGNLSFYGQASTGLGASGTWDSYNATVSGDVTISLVSGALTLSGRLLPAGFYTITTASVALSGKGTSNSPDLASAASISASAGLLNLGPTAMGLSVGGKPLDDSQGVTLAGYSGIVNVSANGNGTELIGLNGGATNVLSILATPASIMADQNTPVSFLPLIHASLADAYSVTALAPIGWTVVIDPATGKVTVTPAPGTPTGTYDVNVLVRSTTNPDLVAQVAVPVVVRATAPGIALNVVSDQLFTVPDQGAELPTSFRASIQNLGPATDTYDLTFSNLPSGFTLLESGTSVTVPAGETGILGLYLQPDLNQPLPAPGTVVSFTVTATSTSNPSITKTQTVTFTVPAIDGVTLTSASASASTTPGVATSVTLTLKNVGNVAETVDLSSAGSAGLVVGGLGTVSLAVGQSKAVVVALTPAGSTAINSLLQTTITATYGATTPQQTTTAQISVDVLSAQVVAIQRAADAVSGISGSQIGNNLSNLAIDLAKLQGSPTDSAALQSVQFLLGNLGLLIQADPALSSFVSGVQSLQSVANAGNVSGLLGMTSSFFGGLAGVLNQEAAQQFALAVTPAEVDVEPGVGKTFAVQLTNNGTATETLTLSLGTIPSNVSASLGQTQVTLAPGASTSVSLTMSQTLVSADVFNLVVKASAGIVKQNTTIVVAVRPATADVLSVTVSSESPAAGSPVTARAEVFNTANAARSVLAQVVVLDSHGNVVDTPPTVPVTLVPGTSDQTVNLGQIPTTGLASGVYTLQVSLLASDGTALPGHSSQTNFILGQPITATISSSATIVPPGTSTVKTTISVADSSTATSTLASNAFTTGDIQAFYLSNESQSIFGVGRLDGLVIAIENASSTPITGGVLTVNPPGGPSDSYHVGTVPADSYVLVEPGLSNDGGTGHTFFNVTGTLLNESRLGPNSSSTKFEFTGAQGTLNIDSGVFTPAATAGPSNDGTVSNFNFLGGPTGSDQTVGDGFGPKVVASLTATPSGGSTPPPTLPIELELGYADNLRANPFFPSPFIGSPNVVFVGDTSTAPGEYDGGVIRIINTSGSSITVNDVSVTMANGVHYDLWGSNVLPAGESLILAQTNGQNFDTSDSDDSLPYPQTYPDGETLHAPRISITVNGVQLPTFLDTGHVLTTGGSDKAAAGDNESENYRPIGTTGEDDLEGLSSIVTVTHNLPTTGYAVDPTSISPTTTTSTATQLVWDATVLPMSDSGPSTFQLSGTVANLSPGEVRQISAGTSIAATYYSTSGQDVSTTINLAPVFVAADHIIGISPPAQSADLDSTVTYSVTLTNPLSTSETYTLSLDGLDGLQTGLAQTVTVSPGQSVTTPLSVTIPFSATIGTRAFTVFAQDVAGARDSVEGQLTVSPEVALPTQAVNVQLSPTEATAGQGTAATYVMTVTNVGDSVDTYQLSGSFPAGFTATFASPTITVLPGESNARQVVVTLTPRAGTMASSHSFTVQAVSTTNSSVVGTASGTVTVVNNGVKVALTPDSNAPGARFSLIVTNTGTVQDTYNLTLGGPAALVSTLGLGSVSLAPGASQTVPISSGAVNFAVQGNLPLVAQAVSTANSSINAAAQANLAIPGTNGLTAGLSPSTQIIPIPGTTSFLLMVNNTGNTEDSYSAVITGTTGSVTASLDGLDGLPTQTIPLFRLPGLSSGAILINADLAAYGTGSVTIRVQSTTNPAMTATETATVSSTPTTTLQIVASATTITVGQPVTFTATVTPVAGATAPTGTVTFTVDGVAQAPEVVSVVGGNAVAALDTSTLSPGVHQVSASFTGVGFASSSSGTVDVQVNKAASSITLLGPTSTVPLGQTVTVIANLTTGNSDVLPTGEVEFFVDGVVHTPDSIQTVNGMVQAVLLLAGLSAGSHQVLASYLGNTNVDPSMSSVLDINVSSSVVVTPPGGEGPQITKIQRYGYHSLPTTYVLTFDQTLDPMRAQETANYRIVGPGGIVVPIRSAVYNSASNTVTLYPSENLDLHQFYTLTIVGTGPSGLTNLSGNLLDGTHSGQPGSNEVVTLRATDLVLIGPVPGGPRQLAKLRAELAQIEAAQAKQLARKHQATPKKTVKTTHATVAPKVVHSSPKPKAKHVTVTRKAAVPKAASARKR